MNLRQEAVQDILEAARWYETQSPGLGERFEDALAVVFRGIEMMPESHRVVYRDVRRAVLQGFPFVVYYQLVEGDALVIAVTHARRDPGHWKSRV